MDDKTAGSHISYLKGQQPTGSIFYFRVCSKVQKNMKILSIRGDLITIYLFPSEIFIGGGNEPQAGDAYRNTPLGSKTLTVIEQTRLYYIIKAAIDKYSDRLRESSRSKD